MRPEHLLMVRLAFGACTLIGGTLFLFSMTARAGEGRQQGLTAVMIMMAGLFLYGVAGLTGSLPWMQ